MRDYSDEIIKKVFTFENSNLISFLQYYLANFIYENENMDKSRSNLKIKQLHNNAHIVNQYHTFNIDFLIPETLENYYLLIRRSFSSAHCRQM